MNIKYEIKTVLPESESGFMSWLLKYLREKGYLDFSITEVK